MAGSAELMAYLEEHRTAPWPDGGPTEQMVAKKWTARFDRRRRRKIIVAQILWTLRHPFTPAWQAKRIPALNWENIWTAADV